MIGDDDDDDDDGDDDDDYNNDNLPALPLGVSPVCPQTHEENQTTHRWTPGTNLHNRIIMR